MANNNELAGATSLHLLQHKDNPVAWRCWGEDALSVARQENKPILLSIGFSACHWCQLMARESFQDPAIAALMNEHFVNIKVDREERPDLDGIFQTAHQLLTGQAGGWPLTVFLCPESHLPFLVGTYFPKETGEGRVGFRELLLRVSEFYQGGSSEYTETLQGVKTIFAALAERQDTFDPEARLHQEPFGTATEALFQRIDRERGGFGGAPKFPMPLNLERLFLAASSSGEWELRARQHLQNTLRVMAQSGISDQLGGGFFRYATRADWSIPRFEKMLCDNGLLLAVYAQAWALLGDPVLEDAARDLARWALRDMRSEEGAFYASLNSETAGQEGACYVWTWEEIAESTDDAERGLLRSLYGLDQSPNFAGKWHLHRAQEWDAAVAEQGLEESEARALYLTARDKLLQCRRLRSRPERDENILTARNGLMIRGLAIAARVFGDREYLSAAQQAVDFIRNKLWLNRRLFAGCFRGATKLSGYLDDYVFLMDGLLELLRIEWRDEDYRFLTALAESLSNNFEDKERGGFWFTAHDAEPLIFRSKPFFDNVLPAGNGVAAKVLGRLGHLCGEPRYLESARRTLLAGWPSLQRQPAEHHSLLQALDEELSPAPRVLLRGDPSMDDWRHHLQQRFGEQIHCYWIPENAEFHPPELFMLEGNQGIICAGDQCLEPQQHLATLSRQIAELLAESASLEDACG